MIGGAPLAESCMMQKTRAGVLPCDIWMFFSPELKNVHQFRYCCQSRKVCSSFRSMFFLTDGECDFGSPNDSLLLDDKFFTCISSATAESMDCDTCLRYQHLYIYIYLTSFSLSLYIYVYFHGDSSQKFRLMDEDHQAPCHHVCPLPSFKSSSWET